MAWRSHGETNAGLIQALTNNGLITSPTVAQAMTKVDRENYVLDKSAAYRDSPQ